MLTLRVLTLRVNASHDWRAVAFLKPAPVLRGQTSLRGRRVVWIKGQPRLVPSSGGQDGRWARKRAAQQVGAHGGTQTSHGARRQVAVRVGGKAVPD